MIDMLRGHICMQNHKEFPQLQRQSSQSGSAIFILFVAVALFGMLGYAFMNSTKTSMGWYEDEKANASQIASADCQLAVASAVKRLEMRGCGTMISNLPDGSNPAPNAPTDGSCSIYHVNGGGVKACTGLATGGADNCRLAPSPGTMCADGTVYAGLTPDGNVKMFTTPADAPGTYPWNNGNTTGQTNTALVNCTTVSPGGGGCRTGESNTTLLASADADSTVFGIQPHLAALYCYNLVAYGHDDWYLPAADELNILFTNRAAGSLNGSFDLTGLIPLGFYISSSEHAATTARRQAFSSGNQFGNLKSNPMSVRCVRKE